MALDEAKRALRQIEKTGLLDKPLTKLNPDEYQQIEDLSNSVLYLEDRIYWLETFDHLRGENKV